MTNLENESTSKLNGSKLKASKCKIYLNNVKIFSLIITGKPRYVHLTHYTVIAVWGNNYYISWNEPKHKNTLYWKNYEFFDVNV